MPPKKQKIFHFPIESTKHFTEITQWDVEEPDKLGPLRIIDLHLDWCGSCEPMVPNYQSLWFEYENPESRLSFWTCPESLLPEELKEKFKLDIQPRFVIYHAGQVKREIKGARYVDLQNAINELIPQEPDD